MQCSTLSKLVLLVLLIVAPLVTVLALIRLPGDQPDPPQYADTCFHGRYCGGACDRRGTWEDPLDMACWEHHLCTLDAGLDTLQQCRCDVDLLNEAERANATDLARAVARTLARC